MTKPFENAYCQTSLSVSHDSPTSRAAAESGYSFLIGILLLKKSRNLVREILVEQQLHLMLETSLRSLSTAKARQARRSSSLRSGKSRRMSSCDIPEAM